MFLLCQNDHFCATSIHVLPILLNFCCFSLVVTRPWTCFATNMDLMFDNAKQYNIEDSKIYKVSILPYSNHFALGSTNLRFHLPQEDFISNQFQISVICIYIQSMPDIQSNEAKLLAWLTSSRQQSKWCKTACKWGQMTGYSTMLVTACSVSSCTSCSP